MLIQSQMKNVLLIICLSLALARCAVAQSGTGGKPFAIAEIGQENTATQTIQFRLYDYHTGKMIWTDSAYRLVPDPKYLGYDPSPSGGYRFWWSVDGQALAFVEQAVFGSWDTGFTLVTWRKGEKRHLYNLYAQSDGFSAISWSPDKKRLLMELPAYDGDKADLRFTELWCLSLSTGHIDKVSKDVGKAKWVSNRKIIYWNPVIVKPSQGVNPPQFALPETPQQWYCP